MEKIEENELKYFAKKGFLLDKEILDFFLKLGDNMAAEQILNQIVSLTKSRVISKNVLIENKEIIQTLFLNLPKDKAEVIESFLGSITTLAKKQEQPKQPETTEQQPADMKILSSNIIPYKRIEVSDFVNYFRNRYTFMKDLLKDRKELTNLVSINKIGDNRNFSIIGMVSKKRVTKNKNVIIELEDLTGRISALVSHDKEELFTKAKEILSDDVIGIKCSGGRDFIYINDIFFPDSFLPEKRKSEDDSYVLFISDIHLGSKLFLEKNFQKFINWINGIGLSESEKEKIKKIKYLFILGDNVDGVGVYPGQEALLEIKDIKNQYIKLAEYIALIPKHISIFMCPGQHDAVRVPEPQPPIDLDFAEDLTKMNNVYLLSNPALIEIATKGKKPGFKILIYHGASMHGWIDELEDLRTSKANMNPSKIVKYMLKHRHLSPMHSSNVYVPSEKGDFLSITDIPDIIATADMHRTDIDIYNNILIICCSCWQSATPFEEKVGNIPDPCKVPMLNLKTREIKILDFSGDFENEVCKETEDKVICKLENKEETKINK